MRTVYGYGRVSEGGHEVSIDRQKEAFAAWWNSSGRRYTYPDDEWTCDPDANWHSDFLISGSTTACMERPGFTSLVFRLKAGDMIFVSMLDRLARDQVDSLTMIKKLGELGVIVLAMDCGKDSGTPEGELILGIFSAVAQHETKRRRTRINDGIRKLYEHGGRMTRIPPRGFRCHKVWSAPLKKYIWKYFPCQVSREFGNLIMKLHDEDGMSWTEISKYLYEKDVPYPPQIVHLSTIMKRRRKGLKRPVTATFPKARLKRDSIAAWYESAKKGYEPDPPGAKYRAMKEKQKQKKSGPIYQQLMENVNRDLQLPAPLAQQLILENA